MNSTFTDFLPEHSLQSLNPEQYRELEAAIKMCNIFSKLNNQSMYLVDYSARTLFYIAPHALLLCGYEIDEVMTMAKKWTFFKKIMPPDTLQMVSEIHEMAWKFIYNAAPDDRAYFRLSYDIYLQHRNGNKILVNQKLVPLLFTEDGNVKISLCVLNYSLRKEAGNVVINQKDKNMDCYYDFKKRKLIPYTSEKLTRREEEVLRLAMQGYNESDIACKMNISIITVRNHRYNAKKKLGVSNLANAVGVFYSET